MELNHGPRGYESLALPLSYAALLSPGGALLYLQFSKRRKGRLEGAASPVDDNGNQMLRVR